MTAATEHARAAGAAELKLWSDTRFTRAHAFYERAGYTVVKRQAVFDKRLT